MGALVASLGMYDGYDGEHGVAISQANDTLWAALAERLRNAGVSGVPARLERARNLRELWADPRLVFAQTCGYPLARHYRETLHVLATPCYDAPGCEGPTHRSFLVVRASSAPLSAPLSLSELRGSRAVINDEESNTGRQLFGDALSDLAGGSPFFSAVAISGSHAESLRRVAEGEADVTSVDCVTYAHVLRSRPDLEHRTRVLHMTRATPSLPYVMSARLGTELFTVVRRALDEALRDPATADARRTLRLQGVVTLAANAYDVTLQFRDRADRVF